MALAASGGAAGAASMAGGSAAVRRAGAMRPGDEQVALWLDEYFRLKTSGETGGARRHGATATQDDLKARIAAHYTGLVESVARRFSGSGEPAEDLVQEGFIGLLSALENYDATKGVKFSTYATHFVAGAMRHCLRDRGKIIKEPAWLNELSGKITRTQEALTQSLGRPASAGEIAHVLNLQEESVEEILNTRHVFHVASFGSGSDDDSDGGSTAGLVDPDKIRSDKHVSLQLPVEDRIVLEGACDKLKALEQKVLHEFFYQDLNQTEIAKKLGISCNYVSHIIKNSTKKLRRILGEADVRDRSKNREQSVLCPATGLYTAMHIAGRAEEELSRAARANYPFALVTVDLWRLPPPGRDRDDVLLALALATKNAIRRVDLAGRFAPSPGAGADDALLVLLPHTGPTASVVSERLETVLLRAATGAEQTRIPASPPRVRVGMAHFPVQGRTLETLLAVARGARADDLENDRQAQTTGANVPREKLPLTA